MRNAIVAECSVGIASASSNVLTSIAWTPASAAPNACSVVRIRLLSGCCAVSTAPDVCVWMRTCMLRGSRAPSSWHLRAQMRRSARILQTSSKTSFACEIWNPKRPRKTSGSSPFAMHPRA